jgi:group I intron endonuclease
VRLEMPARPMMGNATHYASGIYLIENTVNGKRYVGSAVQIRRRWKYHRTQLQTGKHHCRHLQAAWRKYGGEAFTVAVIEFVDRERLIEREQHWIDTLAPEYNTVRVAGSTLGFRFTPEQRAQLSEIQRNRLRPRGWKHSDETRAKIRRALTGQRRTPEQCERCRAAQVGRKLPAETRAKMSAARTGTKRSAETRALMAESARRAHARRREAA